MAVRLVVQLLHEKLAYILAGETLEAQAKRAHEVAVVDGTFIPLMRAAVQSANKIVGVPEGAPDTYKPQTDMPEGVAETTLRQEYRRVRNFQPGGTTSSLTPFKRETLWVQILEGLHFKEAEVLTAIKDQTLLEKFPGLRDVLTKVGMPIDVPEPTPVSPEESPKGDAKPDADKKVKKTKNKMEKRSDA